MPDESRPTDTTDPGRRYLAGRGILHHPGVQSIPVDALDEQLRAQCFPSRRYRDGGGWRSQRNGGFPRRRSGRAPLPVARHRRRSRGRRDRRSDRGRRAARLHDPRRQDGEAVDPAGRQDRRRGIRREAPETRRPVPRLRRRDRRTVRRPRSDSPTPIDGIIGAHGCDGLPKLAKWASTYGDVRIFPHRLDKRDVGRAAGADELADALGGRAIVIRSTHDQPHDLNDELTGKAPRRMAAAGEHDPLAEAVETLADAPEHDEPIPEDTLTDFAARGEVSVLAGRPKSGKSTLIRGEIARATHRGESFLILTEETRGQFRREMRKRDADLARVHVVYLRNLPNTSPSQFRRVVADAVAHTRAGTVVADTWRKVLTRAHPKGMDGENDSGIVDEVVGWLGSLGPAVQIVAHVGKFAQSPEDVKASGGDIFDSVRGSGGLLGAVDRAALMVSPDGDRDNEQRTVYRTGREYRDYRPLAPAVRPGDRHLHPRPARPRAAPTEAAADPAPEVDAAAAAARSRPRPSATS